MSRLDERDSLPFTTGCHPRHGYQGWSFVSRASGSGSCNARRIRYEQEAKTLKGELSQICVGSCPRCKGDIHSGASPTAVPTACSEEE